MNDTALKSATQDIVVDEVFPHPPETIWKTLTTGALIARWLMEQRERPAEREQTERPSTPIGNDERAPASDARGKAAHAVSDNFFADQTGSPPEFRTRS